MGGVELQATVQAGEFGEVPLGIEQVCLQGRLGLQSFQLGQLGQGAPGSVVGVQ